MPGLPKCLLLYKYKLITKQNVIYFFFTNLYNKDCNGQKENSQVSEAILRHRKLKLATKKDGVKYHRNPVKNKT